MVTHTREKEREGEEILYSDNFSLAVNFVQNSIVYSTTMGTSNTEYVGEGNLSLYSRRRMKEEEQKESMHMYSYYTTCNQ